MRLLLYLRGFSLEFLDEVSEVSEFLKYENWPRTFYIQELEGLKKF